MLNLVNAVQFLHVGIVIDELRLVNPDIHKSVFQRVHVDANQEVRIGFQLLEESSELVDLVEGEDNINLALSGLLVVDKLIDALLQNFFDALLLFLCETNLLVVSIHAPRVYLEVVPDAEILLDKVIRSYGEQLSPRQNADSV